MNPIISCPPFNSRSVCEIHRYTLTGTEAMTDEELARLLSTHFDTTITYIEKPLNFFTANSASIEKLKASGVEETMNFPKGGDFERLSGRKPETFEDYLMNGGDTMSPLERNVVSSHTLTMMDKIEVEFPEEKHYITMVEKIGKTSVEAAQ